MKNIKNKIAITIFIVLFVCCSKSKAYKQNAKSLINSTQTYNTYKHDKQAKTVELLVNNKKYHVTFDGARVQDLLYYVGIDLEDDDIINQNVNNPLIDGEQIVIKSPTHYLNSFIHYTPLLPNGTVKLIGTNGHGQRKTLTFHCNTLNKKFLIDIIIKEHLDKYQRIWIYKGKSVPVSALAKGFESVALDENNKPTKYRKKLNNMNCVAYSTNNRWTKLSLKGCSSIPGYVAVNPAKIPYGTKMFIVSADGKFVYGNAIAADTGTGLKAGTCDIDALFDSYEESCWFGRKYLEVYILE